MEMEEALLEAIEDSPTDPAPCLVLADWLEEHDQPERAELLRLGVALRRRHNARDHAGVVELLAAGARPGWPARTNSLRMQFALVPPGNFLMGSPRKEGHRGDDEGKQHRVEIARPCYLGVHTVTQEQYKAVTGKSPSAFRRGGANGDRVQGLVTKAFPVDTVSWPEAVELCRLLGELPKEKKAGHSYRLPTEAEWEYACREAGTCRAPFHFGRSLSADQANFDGNFPSGAAPKGPYLFRITTVGSYPPNALGLYDMHGNVREWCHDWYSPTYYDRSPARDPQGPDEGTTRIVRGGNWVTYSWSCRSADRDSHLPTHGSSFVGFRVVLMRG